MRKYLFSLLMGFLGVTLFAIPLSTQKDVSTQWTWDETSLDWQPMNGFEFSVIVNADDFVVDGCLTAPGGAYPATVFTPACTGINQIIVQDAWAGEYSRVNVTAGNEYTFKSGIVTDYLTISNTLGTVVYTAGVGSVTWTATATEEVRFYLHTNAACGTQNTNRGRSVKCGTAPAEPDYACSQSYSGVFNLASGVTATSNFAVANDFFVPMDVDAYKLESVTFLLLINSGTSTANDFGAFDISILSDNASAPGAVVESFEDLTASNVVLHTETFANLKTFYVTFEIPEGGYVLPVNGAADTRYWLSVSGVTTTAAPIFLVGQQRYDSYVSAPNYSSNTGGASWAIVSSASTPGTFESNWSLEADCTAPAVEGCLDATYGLFPSGTVTPPCLGVTTIATNAWAGEYSNIQVTAGTEYTFASSVSGDFITIGNADGTVVIASGTGSLTWTADANQVVRFYMHADDQCADQNVGRTKTVECGEPFVVEEPDYACFQGDGMASNGPEDGYGIDPASIYRVADDFTVAADEDFTLQYVRLNVLTATAVNNVTLNIRSDAAGMPGAILHTVAMAPTTQTLIGTLGATLKQHQLEFVLATPIELTEGVYWLEPTATNTGATTVYWEVTSTGTDGNVTHTSNTTGTSWAADVDGYRNVFFVAGECGTVEPVEGCLVANEDLPQWPTATFTPNCNGEAVAIATNCWTGEYSKVQVTAGTEYIFSSSVATDFITISDENGTVSYGAGTGALTWTATATEVVRFYLHLDAECDFGDEVNRSRIVQCGEIEEPTGYCIPDALICTDGDVIYNVTFAGINNDSDCSTDGYADYTSAVAPGQVVAGETYEISMEIGAGWYEKVSMWIDFDNNFTFDADERFDVVEGDTGGVLTSQITIPADAADGTYRMRIYLSAAGSDGEYPQDPCVDEANEMYGEIEDYLITVGEGGPTGDCEQIFAGEATGGSGSSSPFMAANDIDVAANTQFTLESVSVDVVPLSGEVTTFDVFIYEDNNGPGAQIGSGHFGLTATSVTPNGTLFDLYPIYTVALDLPTSEVLSGGTSGEKYWVAVIMGASTTSQQVFWIFSPYDSASGSAPLYQSPDDGGSWAPYADETTGENAEGVMTVSGTCGDLGISDLSSFDFAYYPNPVKDELNISAKKLVQSVSVYNLAGQQISTQKLNVTNGKVSTSALTPGIYVFRAVLEGGQVETFKVIKK